MCCRLRQVAWVFSCSCPVIANSLHSCHCSLSQCCMCQRMASGCYLSCLLRCSVVLFVGRVSLFSVFSRLISFNGLFPLSPAVCHNLVVAGVTCLRALCVCVLSSTTTVTLVALSSRRDLAGSARPLCWSCSLSLFCGRFVTACPKIAFATLVP